MDNKHNKKELTEAQKKVLEEQRIKKQKALDSNDIIRK